jgi:hypothetical protein
MSTQPEQLYDENGDPVQTPGEPPRTDAEWAALRREKKANKDKDEQIANLKREAAFRDAGLDPRAEDDLTKMFMKAYDGDITPEAIKAAAIKVGFTDTDVAVADPIVEAAAAASERIAAAAAGGVTETPAGTAALDEAYRTGGIEAMLNAAKAQGITVTEGSGNY